MSLDDYLQIASDERRRNLLYSLRDTDRAVNYDELEEMIDQALLPDGDSEKFTTALAHAHLPRMEEAGIIDHDRNSRKVKYRGDEKIERLLDATEEIENGTL